MVSQLDYTEQARSQNLAARGAKNQMGGPHFYNTVLGVWSNQGAKREMGGNRFQMGVGHHCPPLTTDLTQQITSGGG